MLEQTNHAICRFISPGNMLSNFSFEISFNNVFHDHNPTLLELTCNILSFMNMSRQYLNYSITDTVDEFVDFVEF
jgi:hypothetical protein